MGARTRPSTNWRCLCGAKLLYRSRFVTSPGILDRYYVCSSPECDKFYKSEEKIIAYKCRESKEFRVWHGLKKA